MSEADKEDLAFRYVRAMLHETEKLQVFELILQDDEFKRLLKAELLLLHRLQFAAARLSPAKKVQMLRAVKCAARPQGPESGWIPDLLRPFLPSPIWPIAQYAIRRGLL